MQANTHTHIHTHLLSQLLRAHISVHEPRVISFVRRGGSIISIDQPIMCISLQLDFPKFKVKFIGWQVTAV